jgi:hypothetical protein
VLQSQSGRSGHEQGVGFQRHSPLQFPRRAAIDLVGHQPPWCTRLQAIKDGVHGSELFRPGRIGQVDHQQQPIGVEGFLQGGAEGLQQLRGKLADEAHGVGEQGRAAGSAIGPG